MPTDVAGDRIFLVRQALGPSPRRPLSQQAFAERLNKRGWTGDASKVSKLESGQQRPSLDDVEHIAAIDPIKRGRVWLVGWEDDRGVGSTPQQPPAHPPRKAGRPVSAGAVPSRRRA